jgi:hypothetical protein
MSSLLNAVGPVSVFPYAKWGPLVRHLAKQYRSAKPFPHIHLPSFLEPDVARGMAMAFPRPRSTEWIHYKHANEDKLGLNRRDLFPASIGEVVNELNSPEFVSWLKELTGIPNLFPDPSLDGGGMHQSERGGFLNIHTDFSVHHHHPHWERRVNLILYLNPEWDETWGGALEFWDAGMKSRAAQYFPKLNHAVIFNTDQRSLHGFPEPIRCPDEMTRKSLALYYYTTTARGPSAVRSTNYRARPEDGLIKSLMIRFDSYAVNLYSKAKRRFQFSDRIASRVLTIIANMRVRGR